MSVRFEGGKHLYKHILRVVIVIISLSVILSIPLNAEFNETSDESVPLYSDISEKEEGCNCNEEYNLPLIVIDMKGKSIPVDTSYTYRNINGQDYIVNRPSEKILADMKIYVPGESGLSCICGKRDPDEEYLISIGIRGQSSLYAPKKQYNIKLITSDGQEEKAKLLGMSAHSKWVLNGSYYDRTCLRNYLAYKMAEQTMEYAPDTRFCEVFIKKDESGVSEGNYEYMGLYLLTEKIERGKNRVNIEKTDENYKDVSFIVARDKIKSDDMIIDTNWSHLEESYKIYENGEKRYNTVIVNVYPGKEKLTDDYRKRIKDYLDGFEYSLQSNYFFNSNSGYKKYADVPSFVEYSMINEIFKNVDGGDVSTYFYKDIGGKLKAGPVWDFDQSLGNSKLEEVNEPTGLRIVNAKWFSRMFQDPYFSDMYKYYYSRNRAGIWSDEEIDIMIDQAVEGLGSAILRNEKKWYQGDINIGKMSYSEEVEYMKNFFLARLQWMDNNIDLVERMGENY